MRGKLRPLPPPRIAERHSDGINLLHNNATISTILSCIILLRSCFCPDDFQGLPRQFFLSFYYRFCDELNVRHDKQKSDAQNRSSSLKINYSASAVNIPLSTSFEKQIKFLQKSNTLYTLLLSRAKFSQIGTYTFVIIS